MKLNERQQERYCDSYVNEAEVCPDHVYMLAEIPLKMSISSFVDFS